MRTPSRFAIGSALAAVLVAGCASPAASPPPSSTPPSAGAAATTGAATAAATTASAPRPAPSATARTSAPVEVQVVPCPVPAADYGGTPYSPHAAPATMRLPAVVLLPANAQIFGTEFLPGQISYLVGHKPATCQAAFASADGGESMAAASVSNRSEGVTMVIRPGGVGPSTDLACPYIPAVYAADKAFRQGYTFCDHPSADVIRQIPTGTASLYAAVVLVPARVKDPNIRGSGDGTPAVALYTAQAGPDFAGGQTIACTLAPVAGNVCAASLRFFLATQAQISTRVSAANLTRMEESLAAFLAEQNVR